jgi:hypothetical protein
MSINEYLGTWEAKFINYCEIEKICIANLTDIYETKQNLIKLLGKQKKDDITFYKSIIDNSYFYLTSSLKIRKTKFLKDLNYVWFQIDNFKQMDEINRCNFMALLKDYQKMADDINYAKQNNTILYWVKDDKVESLQQIEKDMNEILTYHINIMEYFNKFILMERNFFCGEMKEPKINEKSVKAPLPLSKDNSQIIL